jgi:hypothetical protein
MEQLHAATGAAFLRDVLSRGSREILNNVAPQWQLQEYQTLPGSAVEPVSVLSGFDMVMDRAR